MMTNKPLSGTLLNEQVTISVTEICQACSCRTELIVELVHEGVLDPLDPTREEWHFSGNSLATVRAAHRLQRDLGINVEGIALVLELMDEISTLRSQVQSQSAVGD